MSSALDTRAAWRVMYGYERSMYSSPPPAEWEHETAHDRFRALLSSIEPDNIDGNDAFSHLVTIMAIAKGVVKREWRDRPSWWDDDDGRPLYRGEHMETTTVPGGVCITTRGAFEYGWRSWRVLPRPVASRNLREAVRSSSGHPASYAGQPFASGPFFSRTRAAVTVSAWGGLDI